MHYKLSDISILQFMGFALVLVVLIGAFARPRTPDCPEGTMAWVETRLFMGRDIPKAAGGGEVTDAQWQAFTNSDIISRFPKGFTVLDAAGYWQGEGCDVADLPGGCERSKMLLIQYAPGKEAEAAINAAANAYRARFSQQSVMRSDARVCTQFYAG